MDRKSTFVLMLSLLTFAAAAFVYAYGSWYRAPAVDDPASIPVPPPRPTEPLSPPDVEENEAVRVFKECKDSVVNVDTYVRVRRFDASIAEQQTGSGSGFVWDDAGHVVTNFHVIKDAVGAGRAIRVVGSDRSAWEAKIVGVSPDHDLAVLKLRAGSTAVKKIRVGQSAGLEVGHKVYAIGNPFGLSLSMTKGIISALEREINSPSDRIINNVIQTDAPINPGNSGGPLLNKDGLLIGVNTAIKTPSGGNVGIGFAIPVDTVTPIVTELIARGRILQPDIGVKLVDQWRVRRVGITTGVMISSIEEGSPAEKAGLRGLVVDRRTGEVEMGDVILSINGKEVKGNTEFAKMISSFKIGDSIRIVYERNEERKSAEVTLRGI
ncbi:MAG: S1C family serine protease [Fimbriiglobus sp.]